MADQKTSIQLTLDEQRAHTLFGNHDENLRTIEDAFDVKISSRGNEIHVGGSAENRTIVEKLIDELQQLIEQGYPLKKSDVQTGVRVIRDRPRVSGRRTVGAHHLCRALPRIALTCTRSPVLLAMYAIDRVGEHAIRPELRRFVILCFEKHPFTRSGL